MNTESAINIIDQVYGFDDETTTVGEAWKRIKSDLYTANQKNFRALAGELLVALKYAIGQVPELETVHGIKNAIDRAKQEGVIE